MSTTKKTTKKAKKETKPKPPCRIFFGGELYHEAQYDDKERKMDVVYHNSGLDEKVEEMLSRNLTEAARTIIAENPDTGLLRT